MNTIKKGPGVILRGLLILAGASLEAAIKATALDRLKLYFLGSAVTVPAFLGGFGAVAVYLFSVPGGSWPLAIVAFVAGFGAMALVEASLNASLSPSATRREKMRACRPRIAVALVLGAIIGGPLAVAYHDGLINAELRGELQEQVEAIAEPYRRQIVEQERKQEVLTARVRAKEQDCEERLDAFIGEAEGTSGTRRRGIGRIAKIKDEAKASCEADLERLRGEAAAEKEHLGREIQVLRAEQAKAEQDVKGHFRTDVAKRLAVLFELAQREAAVLFKVLNFYFLVLFLDVYALGLKVLVNVPSYSAVEESLREEIELQQQMERRKKQLLYQELENAWGETAVLQAETQIFEARIEEEDVKRPYILLEKARRLFELMKCAEQKLEDDTLSRLLTATLEELEELKSFAKDLMRDALGRMRGRFAQEIGEENSAQEETVES